jgi:uncharacterized integral membrane protein
MCSGNSSIGGVSHGTPPIFCLFVLSFAALYGGSNMRYIVAFSRLLLFLVLLSFAVKNDQPVTLHYFFGYQWQASLVVVLLVFFAAGSVVGMLAILGNFASA